MTQAQITIRRAERADAPAIHRLHTCSVQILCRSHYTPAQLAGWIGRRQPAGYLPAIERNEMFVAMIAAQLVGFGHAVPGEIAAIFVDPAWTGRGVGRQLVNYAIPLAQGPAHGPVHLEATLNARHFYERCGFERIGQKIIQRGQAELAVVVMAYRGQTEIKGAYDVIDNN